MNFEELILSIIHDHSGGIKFLELLTEVVCRGMKGAVEEISNLLLVDSESSPVADALDGKLEEMRRSGQIGLLDYAYPLGGGQVRGKTFVYLPIGD